MSPEERRDEKGRLLDEYQQLTGDHALLVERVRRLGRTMSEIGAGLQSHPERVFVAIQAGTTVIPRSDWVIAMEEPPRLLDIERMTEEIRSGKARLAELRRLLAAQGINVS